MSIYMLIVSLMACLVCIFSYMFVIAGDHNVSAGNICLVQKGVSAWIISEQGPLLYSRRAVTDHYEMHAGSKRIEAGFVFGRRWVKDVHNR